MGDNPKFTLNLLNNNLFSANKITKAILKRITRVENDNELDKIWQARLALAAFRTMLLLVLWVVIVSPLVAHVLQILFHISPDISENVLEVSGLVFAIGYDIVKERLHWAIFYLIWYAWFVLSGKIPASVLAIFNLSGQAYALEACTMLVIITFVIGSWRLSRWVSAGGCIATIVFWIIWFNAAYDFLSITFIGFLPAYPVSSQQYVKDPPYDFALIGWTACGLLALLITVAATCFVVRDVFLGIRWVRWNIRPEESLNTVPRLDAQQIAKKDRKKSKKKVNQIGQKITRSDLKDVKKIADTLASIAELAHCTLPDGDWKDIASDLKDFMLLVSDSADKIGRLWDGVALIRLVWNYLNTHQNTSKAEVAEDLKNIIINYNNELKQKTQIELLADKVKNIVDFSTWVLKRENP